RQKALFDRLPRWPVIIPGGIRDTAHPMPGDDHCEDLARSVLRVCRGRGADYAREANRCDEIRERRQTMLSPARTRFPDDHRLPNTFLIDILRMEVLVRLRL